VLATGLAVTAAKAELVGHWRFDETRGTTVSDSSGNGHDGTVVEGTPIWDSDGKYGGCLDFDETYGVAIPAGVFSDIRDAITISTWVNGNGNQTSTTTVILQAGTGVGSDHKLIVSVYWGWKGDEVRFETGYDDDNSETWSNAGLKSRTGKWGHYAFVTDTTARFQGIYHNGRLVKEGTTDASMAGVTKAHIGLATDKVHDQFVGKLDNIHIYNNALSAEEVRQLYKLDPALHELAGAIRQAEAAIETIVFLEKKIAESEQWKEKNPNKDVSYHRELSFDLHFLLARAKEAAGFPKKQVEAGCKRGFKHGTPSLSNSASVLLWLSESGKTEEFERIIKTLTKNDKNFLGEVVTTAGKMVLKGKSRAAIRFLESSLATYAQCRHEHPRDHVAAQDSLPEMYFQLAKAKQAIGASSEDITDAYSKTFTPSRNRFVADEKYKEAGQLYGDLMNRCGPHDDRSPYELQLYKCAFLTGEYRDTIARLARYIAKNKDLNPANMKEALLLKARAHVRVREFDKAVASCLFLTTAYPGTKQIPEAGFFMGYCHMLQGDLEKAREVLEGVVRNYPENSYANNARLCLGRIKNTVE
jgi:tetratricopeptide (TPR) repeat protein